MREEEEENIENHDRRRKRERKKTAVKEWHEGKVWNKEQEKVMYEKEIEYLPYLEVKRSGMRRKRKKE